jgi:hypothetical protein
MADPSSSAADGADDQPSETAPRSDAAGADADAEDRADDAATGATESEGTPDPEADLETLRRAVEEKYDFDDFGPADMAEMSVEEWEAAFDIETWITGPELLDRVEQDLQNRIAGREVFAALRRFTEDGEPRLLAYSDEGYAIVHPDGGIEGRGTVLRDVKPTVALCSMEDYEVPDPPESFDLPKPEDVAEGTGQLGNNMLQAIAAAQLLAGLGVLAVWLFTDAIPNANGAINLVAPVLGAFFLLVGLFLFSVVANARLSDRFRAEEYRNRLRAIGTETGEVPEFVPVDPDTGRRRPVGEPESAPELDES